MAKFPIVEARQELGFTPSTAVRADIDVRQGDVGAAVGQAILAGGREVQRESVRKQVIRQRNRDNLDSLSADQATELRKQMRGDIEVMKLGIPPEKWEEETTKIVTAFNGRIAGLDFSPDALAEQQIVSESNLELVPEESLIASSRRISAATVKSTEQSLTDVHRNIPKNEFGLRPDGTRKGTGFLGVLPLKGGGVATEFSVGVRLEAKGGEETDIPSLVPTLTEAEIDLMVNDIIPNRKNIPSGILQKAVDHANKRVREGKSVFAVDGASGDIAQAKLDAVATWKRNGVSAPEIMLKLDAAEKAGVTLRKKDVLDSFQEQASVNPEATIETLNAELEARKTGDGVIDDLPSDSIQAVINMANNRITQKVASAQAQLNTAQGEAEKDFYNRLSEEDADRASIMSEVQSSILDVSAIRRLEQDEADFAKKDVSQTWPLSDDDSAVQEINRMLSDQSAGRFSAVDVNRIVNAMSVDNRLTRETRDRLRVQANRGGSDAIDEAVNDSVARIANAAIGRLTDIQARLRVRQEAGTLTPEEQRQAGSAAFLLQVEKEQLARITIEIDTRIRALGKDVVSGVEATTIASQVWEKFRVKPLTEKIEDFKVFSGQRIPKPDDFPQSIWDTATPRDKANIVDATSRGMDTTSIMEMVNR